MNQDDDAGPPPESWPAEDATFRGHLFRRHPQPMWIYDTGTLRFLDVNEAAVDRYGYARDEFLAMTIADIRPAEDVPDLQQAVAGAREDGERGGVWRHRRRDGGVLMVEIASIALRYDGRDARLVLATDVTRSHVLQERLRASNQCYERQQRALAELMRGRLWQYDDETSLREITATAARVLEVGRASIWRLNAERDAIVLQDLFDAATAGHSTGTTIPGTTAPAYFRALHSGEIIDAEDACADPRTREFTEDYLQPLGIGAMLDAPIFVAGRLDGVLCLEHVGPPRRWTDEERVFVVSFANLVSLVLAQRELAHSESHLRAIVDNEPECVKIVSADGRVLEMNPAGLRLLEGSAQQIIGRPVLGLIHPEDREVFMELHQRVLRGGSGQLRFRILSCQGSLRWMETHSAPLRDRAGEVHAVLSVARDITASRQAEEELRRREALLRMSSRMSRLGAWTIDLSTGRLICTEEWLELHELPAGSAPDRRQALDLHAPEFRARLQAALEDCVMSHVPFDFESQIITARGRRVWVRILGEAVLDQHGAVVRVQGATQDISQRKHEELLQQVEQQLLELISTAAPLRAVFDRLVAATQALLPGSIAAIRLDGEDPAREQDPHGDWTTPVIDSAGVVRALFTVYRAQAQPAGDADRAVITRLSRLAGIAIERDRRAADLRESEERLRQSQRLETAGQLTGGVAHDFNNLLTVIIGNAGLLQESFGAHDERRHLVEMIGAAAERGAELTQRLLAFARRQALAPRAVDAGGLLSGMADLLRRTLGEHIEIEVRPGAATWPVLVDPGQLENALLNLAINARDAMPGGGRLTIEAANAELDEDYVSRHADARPGAHVMLAVSDTGVGIAPENLARVFEPFYTTKPRGKGTGLGLAMVYGFIRQSGGHVNIYSEPGSGTTVRIYLPRADEVAANEPTRPVPEVVGGTETVLLVEDDAPVREFARSQLLALGYRVLEAPDGPRALEVLRVHDDIDLLFTDVVMPGGMNGAQLASAARELRPGLRVLYTSGYTENAILHHDRLDAGVQLLSKPYRSADLARKLREALATPVAGEQFRGSSE
ncbi:MAG: PAS domain S-box protein [Gammaproteobacteria bacterium]|nr:MAG: PAS domain S-box protein [Gammaproteobacteria bacterium]